MAKNDKELQYDPENLLAFPPDRAKMNFFDMYGGDIITRVSLYDLIDSLDAEQRREMAEHLTWGPVLEEAMARLVSRSVNFSTEDFSMQLNFLSKVEDALLSGFKWGALRRFKEEIEKMANHREIYYAMMADSENRDFFQRWLDSRGLTNHYRADYPEVADFQSRVDDIFTGLAEFKDYTEEVILVVRKLKDQENYYKKMAAKSSEISDFSYGQAMGKAEVIREVIEELSNIVTERG